MEFQKVSELKDFIGKSVKLRGWVYRKREQKNLIFLVLRDSTGIVQIACRGLTEAETATMESSIEVEGLVKEDSRAPTGVELQAEKINIVGLAGRFPIAKDLSEEFTRDIRHLWIRNQKLAAIFRIRSTVFSAIHEFFHSKDYYEVQAPILTSNVCEGGSTLFRLDLEDKDIYLSQSWQLYAEAMIQVLEKIYTITPAFRAEKSRTTRHLSEYWTAEAEIAWEKMDFAIKLAEDLISHVVKIVLDKNLSDLERAEAKIEQLKKIQPPFPRITYTEAVERLKSEGSEIKWGEDLRTTEEAKIASWFEKPVIVTHYPVDIMAFYKPADPENPKLALNFDILAPNGDEIVGGSERSNDIDYMKKRLEKDGARLEDYEWYFDLRRFGAVPHSGFGLGMERLIKWICALEHVMDAIPFPRTMDRMKP